jgi:hypothetical protein
MGKQDTGNLLKECDAGTKMAVSSIDDVMDYVEDDKLYRVLVKSREHHEKLGNEIHRMLNERGLAEKDPSIMASGMSWMKTNMKMMADPSDQTIAELITDGCNMGVKSLNEYLNEYEEADESIRDICSRLIGMEQALCEDVAAYL